MTNTKDTHTCHAIGCETIIQPKLFMCSRHWTMVPHEMKQLIWRTYRPEQEIDKKPSELYIRAAHRIIIGVRRFEQSKSNTIL